MVALRAARFLAARFRDGRAEQRESQPRAEALKRPVDGARALGLCQQAAATRSMSAEMEDEIGFYSPS